MSALHKCNTDNRRRCSESKYRRDLLCKNKNLKNKLEKLLRAITGKTYAYNNKAEIVLTLVNIQFPSKSLINYILSQIIHWLQPCAASY